jgi:hypothetical protein
MPDPSVLHAAPAPPHVLQFDFMLATILKQSSIFWASDTVKDIKSWLLLHFDWFAELRRQFELAAARIRAENQRSRRFVPTFASLLQPVALASRPVLEPSDVPMGAARRTSTGPASD